MPSVSDFSCDSLTYLSFQMLLKDGNLPWNISSLWGRRKVVHFSNIQPPLVIRVPMMASKQKPAITKSCLLFSFFNFTFFHFSFLCVLSSFLKKNLYKNIKSTVSEMCLLSLLFCGLFLYHRSAFLWIFRVDIFSISCGRSF